MSILKCAKITTPTKHLRTHTSTDTNSTQQLPVANVRGQGSYSSSAPSSVGCPSEPPTHSKCHSQGFRARPFSSLEVGFSSQLPLFSFLCLSHGSCFLMLFFLFPFLALSFPCPTRQLFPCPCPCPSVGPGLNLALGVACASALDLYLAIPCPSPSPRSLPPSPRFLAPSPRSLAPSPPRPLAPFPVPFPSRPSLSGFPSLPLAFPLSPSVSLFASIGIPCVHMYICVYS